MGNRVLSSSVCDARVYHRGKIYSAASARHYAIQTMTIKGCQHTRKDGTTESAANHFGFQRQAGPTQSYVSNKAQRKTQPAMQNTKHPPSTQSQESCNTSLSSSANDSSLLYLSKSYVPSSRSSQAWSGPYTHDDLASAWERTVGQLMPCRVEAAASKPKPQTGTKKAPELNSTNNTSRLLAVPIPTVVSFGLDFNNRIHKPIEEHAFRHARRYCP